MTRKGWCPGALRPMLMADGLLLRIRPYGSRLSAAQIATIAELTDEFGQGQAQLSNRATVQLRGIREGDLPALHQRLSAAGLLDADPRLEALRNITVTPFWTDGDGIQELAQSLATGLEAAPDLPAKFGFAIDCAGRCVLGQASADLRVERAGEDLLIRADGMERGEVVAASDIVPRIIEILHWFAQTCHRRMAHAVAAGAAVPIRSDVVPDAQLALDDTLRSASFLFAPLGTVTAAALREVAGQGLRLTPWRAVLPDIPLTPAHWITDPDDPLLRVSACTGAPGCGSASVATREVARQLAPLIPKGRHLHVSGCAKGCAHPQPASVTLTGRDGGFDLVLDGPAGGGACRCGLAPTELSAAIRGQLGT